MSSLNTEDERPEIVLLQKEWLPQPNGHYFLEAFFYTKNFIPKFVTFQTWLTGTAVVPVHIKVSFHINCAFPAGLTYAHIKCTVAKAVTVAR